MIKITFYGKKPKGRTVCALGFFDGVHLGHQKLFRECIRESDGRYMTMAVTFDKHPLRTVAPERAPLLINTLQQKIRLILEHGIDTVAVVHFTHDFAVLQPEDFIRQVLTERLNAIAVVIGNNFRFGRGRQGTGQTLRQVSKDYDYLTNIIAPLQRKGGPVSSTRIRSAIQSCRMEDAAMFLGAPFTLEGKIETGFRIGTQLGYPTANLSAAQGQVLPGNGVYLIASDIDGTTYFGGCNVGVRPTFGIHAVSIEAHFLDWHGDLYGREMSFRFIKKIRDEMEFDSPEVLIDRLHKDLKTVEALRDKYTRN